VPELVDGNCCGASRLIAKADTLLPAGEGQPQRGIRDRLLRIEPGREQPRRPAGAVLADVVLLGADRLNRPRGQGKLVFGAHLRAGEPQAGPAGTVGQHRVERQCASIPGPEPGLGDQHDQVPVRQPELDKVLLGFQLAHHEFRDEPGQCVAPAGQLLRVDRRPGRDGRHPPVTAVLLQKAAEEHPGQCLGGIGQRQWCQVAQVAFQQRPVDVPRPLHRRLTDGQET